MKNKSVKKLEIALEIEKEVVGIKFIDYKKQFEKIDLSPPQKKGPFCYLVRHAMDGNFFKANANTITCDYSKYALGIAKPNQGIKAGRSYAYCGLYESNAIAKNIVDSMQYNEQEIYGVIIGPLKLMEDADVVIIAGYSETIMRVVQGYAYKYGNPKNLSCFGNQAMCADLVSKPYANNDINISLMCRGARANGRFDKGEIAVGLPISMFDHLADGIVKTINPVSNPKEKDAILDRAENALELIGTIDKSYNYGQGLYAYDDIVKDNEEKNISNCKEISV